MDRALKRVLIGLWLRARAIAVVIASVLRLPLPSLLYAALFTSRFGRLMEDQWTQHVERSWQFRCKRGPTWHRRTRKWGGWTRSKMTWISTWVDSSLDNRIKRTRSLSSLLRFKTAALGRIQEMSCRLIKVDLAPFEAKDAAPLVSWRTALISLQVGEQL